MHCPECHSTHNRKNGKREGKQNHICVKCGRQFIGSYEPPKGSSDQVKRECLKLYVNGLSFRAIERIKGVHHTTIITWIKQVGQTLSTGQKLERMAKLIDFLFEVKDDISQVVEAVAENTLGVPT